MHARRSIKAALGIDLGTSSVKALLLDEGGKTLGVGRADYQVETPHPGWSECEPEAWWGSVVVAVKDLLAQVPAARVVAIGLSGQMHGIVLVDGQKQVLRPAILWSDTRAEEELALFRALPASALQRLANPLVPGMAGPLLCWLQRHEVRSYQAARWMLQPKDWVRLRLTDTVASERSDASATLLYDLLDDRWAKDIVKDLGLRTELLPEVVASSAVAGFLSAQAADELGLAQGIPVAAGAADTAAAALGTGLNMSGTVQLTLGTGAQLIEIRAQPEPDPTLRTHLYRSADETSWYAMAAVQNAGLALNWVCQVLNASWDELYNSAAMVPAGSSGVLFLPYLTRERPHHQNMQSQGGWLHLRIDQRREQLLHAALEGVAFGLREALEALPGADRVDTLRLAGGGGKYPEWRQMLANILHRRLVGVDVPDASARGAALLGGLAGGIWSDYTALANLAPGLSAPTEPEPEQAARYEVLYREYLRQAN